MGIVKLSVPQGLADSTNVPPTAAIAAWPRQTFQGRFVSGSRQASSTGRAVVRKARLPAMVLRALATAADGGVVREPASDAAGSERASTAREAA